MKDKIQFIISQIKSVTDKCKELEELLRKIDTWNLDMSTNNKIRILAAMRSLNDLCGKNREMFDFLVNNFNTQEDTH